MTGFLYAVRSSNGLFKIGYTNDPPRRFTMLKTSTADALELVGVIPGTLEHERQLHHLLRRSRIAREWFEWTPAMQVFLDALKPVPTRRRRRSSAAVAMPDWLLRLGAAIEADGRSYRKLSLRSGLGPNFVHQIMSTGRSPSTSNLESLARTLGIGVASLFEGRAAA